MSKENGIQALVDLGLTELQARVYLALVISGRSSARTIANLSNVARQETYRILSELLKLGLISKIISTPTKFEPLPLSDCVSLMLEKRIKKTEELVTQTRKLGMKHKFTEDFEESADVGYRFVEIPEKYVTIRREEQKLSSLKTLDLLVSSKKFKPWIFLYEEKMMNALNRGAKMRFIIDKPECDIPAINALRKKPSFNIRYVLKHPPVQFAIINNEEVSLSTAPSAVTIRPILASNHPSLVHLAQQYFEITWFTALEAEHQEDK
jgi:hypothetical protein